MFDAIEDLREREQRILNLYYNFGYKDREIANLYKISRSGVTKIRNRALEKCKEQLCENIV